MAPLTMRAAARCTLHVMLVVDAGALSARAHVPTASQTPHATVCFVRHGESEWNAAKRFTGWTDVDLTDHGREEAACAGKVLRENGLIFDRAYTSELRRAQETLAIALHASAQHSVPQMRHWRLNERHYGLLQGRSKQECVDEYGVEQIRIWRNSFATPPPLVSSTSPSFPGNCDKYHDVPPSLLPRGECLRDTLARCVPFWDEHVVPELHAGRRVLIAAHGHSIRCLVKHLDSISDDGIASLSIPNGIPLVYHLDEQLQPMRPPGAVDGALRGIFLGDEAKVAAADWLLPQGEAQPVNVMRTAE